MLLSVYRSTAYQGKIRDPYGQIGRTPFLMAHQGGPDMELMTALGGVYDAAAPSLRFTAPHCRHEVRQDDGKQAQQAWRPTRIGQSSLAKVEKLRCIIRRTAKL